MAQIHQEVHFDASPARVFRALTSAEEFAEWTGAAARLEASEGGRFQLFGEFIVGMTVELVADKRVVQAWRVYDWEPGLYSIARFELVAEGEGTKLVFDQEGVPADAEPHIDKGWGHKYWEPMKTYLSTD